MNPKPNSKRFVFDVIIVGPVSIHHFLMRFIASCNRSEDMLSNFTFTITTESSPYASGHPLVVLIVVVMIWLFSMLLLNLTIASYTVIIHPCHLQLIQLYQIVCYIQNGNDLLDLKVVFISYTCFCKVVSVDFPLIGLTYLSCHTCCMCIR